MSSMKHGINQDPEQSSQWLSERLPMVGLNADWNSSAWHIGPGGKANWVSGDIYIVEDEEADGPFRFWILQRFYQDDMEEHWLDKNGRPITDSELLDEIRLFQGIVELDSGLSAGQAHAKALDMVRKPNPKKEKVFLVHVAHRGVAYFGLASTLRAAKRKLDQVLKGTGLTSDSASVLDYEIRYNPKTGEGWSSTL